MIEAALNASEKVQQLSTFTPGTVPGKRPRGARETAGAMGSRLCAAMWARACVLRCGFTLVCCDVGSRDIEQIQSECDPSPWT